MQHFSHPHKLYVASHMHNENLACFGCKIPLFGTCYACTACNFYLHKFCFDLPQSAHFDSHPKHTLTLLYPPYCQRTCDACGESCDGFTYNCALCNYNVHANCSTLLQPDPRNERGQYSAAFLGQKVSEVKTLKNQLESTVERLKSQLEATVEQLKSQLEQQQTIEQEEANVLQMAMEGRLHRMRLNVYTAGMLDSAYSIDAMGRIK